MYTIEDFLDDTVDFGEGVEEEEYPLYDPDGDDMDEYEILRRLEEML